MIVQIFCDGACSNSSGGWATLLKVLDRPETQKTFSGHADNTTNNRMELQAAIEGLKALKFPCEVELFSDSQYLCFTMNKGWKRSVNNDLWEELDRLASIHKVTWCWMRRNSTPELIECDRLAKNSKS